MAQTITTRPTRPTLPKEPLPLARLRPEWGPRPGPASRRPRTAGAGDALVAILVCLGVWALLFAPALERSAETGPDGARRNLALAILRPLSSVSDALALDRVGDAVMRAIGRDPDAQPGGELVLPDLDLPPLHRPSSEPDRDPPSTGPQPGGSPSPEGDGPPAEPGGEHRPPGNDPPPREPDPLRTPSEDAKLRVAVVGDSLAQGLGPSVAAWFDPDVSRVLSLGRQSTGLARQDYFNWQVAIRQVESEFRPDLIFVLLGSNDNQAQITSDSDPLPVGSVEWVHSYREQAASFLEAATSSGTRVIWVGVPVVRDHERWDFYRRVNGIYEQVASADPLATYVDAWELFQAGGGGYAAYLRNERGVLQEMRAGDGVHFTPAGYDYLAREAIRAAGRAFDLAQRAVAFRI